MSQEVKDALQKYNVEAIQKLKSTRNLHETNFAHDLHEITQKNSISSNEDDQMEDGLLSDIVYGFGDFFGISIHDKMKTSHT